MEITPVGYDASRVEWFAPSRRPSKPVSHSSPSPENPLPVSDAYTAGDSRHSIPSFTTEESMDFRPIDAQDIELDSAPVGNTQIRFSKDKESGRMAIALIDSSTEEIIREIPSQRILDALGKLRQSMDQVFDLIS